MVWDAFYNDIYNYKKKCPYINNKICLHESSTTFDILQRVEQRFISMVFISWYKQTYDWFDFKYNRKLGAIIITVHHYLQMSKVYIYWCRLMNFSIYYYIAWITAKLDNYCWKNCGGRRGEVMIFGFSSWSGTLLPFFSGAMYFTEWSLGVQFWSWIGLESNFWSTGTFWKYK